MDVVHAQPQAPRSEAHHAAWFTCDIDHGCNGDAKPVMLMRVFCNMQHASATCTRPYVDGRMPMMRYGFATMVRYSKRAEARAGRAVRRRHSSQPGRPTLRARGHGGLSCDLWIMRSMEHAWPMLGGGEGTCAGRAVYSYTLVIHSNRTVYSYTRSLIIHARGEISARFCESPGVESSAQPTLRRCRPRGRPGSPSTSAAWAARSSSRSPSHRSRECPPGWRAQVPGERQQWPSRRGACGVPPWARCRYYPAWPRRVLRRRQSRFGTLKTASRSSCWSVFGAARDSASSTGRRKPRMARWICSAPEMYEIAPATLRYGQKKTSVSTGSEWAPPGGWGCQQVHALLIHRARVARGEAS